MSRKVRQFTISNKLVIRIPMTALVLSLAQLMVAYRTSCVVIAEKQPFSILRCFNHQVQCSQRPIAPSDQSFSDLQLVANCHQPVGKIWVISPLRIHLVFNRLVLLPQLLLQFPELLHMTNVVSNTEPAVQRIASVKFQFSRLEAQQVQSTSVATPVALCL